MYAHTHDFIFVSISKTGSISLEKVFLKYSDDKLVPQGIPPKRKKRKMKILKGKWTRKKHQSLQEYHDIMPQEIFEKQKIVTSLRHPVDRLVSLHYNLDRQLQAINDDWLKKIARKPFNWFGIEIFFLEWRYLDRELDVDRFKRQVTRVKSQSDFLRLNGKIKKPDVIIDFAHFEQSALDAFKKLGLPETKISYENKSLTKQPKDILIKRPDVIDIVMNSHHAEDFETFPDMDWKV